MFKRTNLDNLIKFVLFISKICRSFFLHFNHFVILIFLQFVHIFGIFTLVDSEKGLRFFAIICLFKLNVIINIKIMHWQIRSSQLKLFMGHRCENSLLQWFDTNILKL